MTERSLHMARRWFWAAVAMTVFKLWLTRGQHILAIGPAGHDDRLFLQLAEHLLNGDWLGPYNQMTLAKGPFYSLWIAFVSLLGIPLFLSQHLLYAGSCAALVRACAPAICSPAVRFFFYALLLWNPMSYDASSMGRVLRQHVYSPLVLLIIAGLAALYYRRAEPLRRLAPWVVMLGLSFAGFWLTREEGVWLMPAIVLLGAAVIYGAWRTSREALRRAALSVVVATACAVLPILVVAGLNFRNYGWFGTVEFRAKEFKDAYGAMVRVKVGPDMKFVPVTREAREAMYGVSPAFATLRPHLEGAIGFGWAEASASVTRLPPAERQIGGGWLMWALRDAVITAGHGTDAGTALAFYRRMADEINAACEQEKLAAWPERSGFLPVWRAGQTREVIRTFLSFADFVASFRTFSAFAPPSDGDDNSLLLFRDLTGEKLSHPAEGTSLVATVQSEFNTRRTSILHSIGKLLRRVLLPLIVLAHIAAFVRVVQIVTRLASGFPPAEAGWTFLLTLAIAAWGSCAAYLAITAIIEVTSFPVMVISSFAPAYPVALLFAGAALVDAGNAWWPRRVRTEPAVAERKSFVEPDATPTPAGIPISARLATALPWIAAALALFPLLIWWSEFAKLFWFGDDYFLADQISQMGVLRWTWTVFAENFTPVFKMFWAGGLTVFDGSYMAIIVLMWLTHALNTLCLGRLLLRAGFPWLAAIAVQVVFGLAPANIETLAWSVQWSATLATTFLLFALLWQERHAAQAGVPGMRVHGPLLLLSAASACCFSRGVLTGAVLALGQILTGDRNTWWRRGLAAGICVLPALVVALIIKSSSLGNHQQMEGHWLEAIEFGAAFFLVNPGYLLLGAPAMSHGQLVLFLGAAKIAVVGLGLWRSRGRVRHLLLLLLAYDLGNAVLLGIGRYHTGFGGVVASRYYYGSLLATLPCCGLLLSHAVEAIVRGIRWRQLAAAAVLLLLAWLCLGSWPAELDKFVGWRGSDIRALMAEPYTNDPTATVPALDFMHVERAKALIRTYNLH